MTGVQTCALPISCIFFIISDKCDGDWPYDLEYHGGHFECHSCSDGLRVELGNNQLDVITPISASDHPSKFCTRLKFVEVHYSHAGEQRVALVQTCADDGAGNHVCRIS